MRENKMGVMPVGRLLFTMSIPMIASMMVQALYNIVDSVFVAMVNEEALTAVSLAFPIQNLMISLGVGTGAGVNALCARYLGAKDNEKADSVARHGIILSILTSIFFMGLILLFTKPFYRSFTSDPVIYNYSLDYTYIVGFFCVGIMIQTMFEKILQSTGRTFYSMVAQMVGAVINIILDPIFIFGMFGIPRLEVKGAAIATVIGQICGGTVAIYLVLRKNPEIKISFKNFKIQPGIIFGIYQIGIPIIILSSVGSIMSYGFNKILIGFSSTAAAVFGAYFKLQSFVFMTIFGIDNGLIPIVAYNFGASKPKRILEVMKYAYISVFIIMFLGFLSFQILPKTMLSFFSASADMLEIGVPALRAVSWHFCIAGFCIVTGGLFQALGRAVYSMVNSILRQLLLILPVAYILAKVYGLYALWWAFPISEVGAGLVTLYFLIKVNKEIIKPMMEKSAGAER